MPTRRLKSISTPTVADSAYQALLELILEGNLAPGEVLREQDLSERLGVSRTPIREALSRIASEGLIEHIPRRGYRTSEAPVSELVELYPIISSLELLAGRTSLPVLDDLDLARLKKINEALTDDIEQDRVFDAVMHNNEFHAGLCVKCGNAKLIELLAQLRQQVGRVEVWFYSSHEHGVMSTDQHVSLMDALQAGDHANALALLESDYFGTYESILEATGHSKPE